MASVFIAYSSKDMRFLSKLRQELRLKATHEVFIAEFLLQPGQEWRREIEANLRKAKFFVPLISQNFLDSPEARRELSEAIDLADQHKLTIIPLLIQDVERTNLPLIVKATQYIRFQPFDSMVDSLLNALELTSSAPLTNRATLEEYVSRTTIDGNELVSLAQQVLHCQWPKKRDKSGAIKFIADKLRGKRHPDKALSLYNVIVEELYPNNVSLRVARADINTELGNYEPADNDCAIALAREPNNPWALLRRFWVNHAWALSKPSADESREQRMRLDDCLERLKDSAAATSASFFGSYIRALGEGAKICQKREYADTALILIKEGPSSLRDTHERKHQVAVLRALITLERIYQGLGDTGSVDQIHEEREKCEDNWQLYEY